MGEVGQMLVSEMIGQAMIEVVGDLMLAARGLSCVAEVIVEERVEISPEMILEASARCIDIVELIVKASVSQAPHEMNNERMEQFRRSSLRGDMDDLLQRLDTIRSNILNTNTNTQGE